MTYTVLRILTYVLGITGSALLLPVAVAMIEGERHMLVPFLIPMAVAWGLAAVFWLKVREKPKVIGLQDAQRCIPYFYGRHVRKRERLHHHRSHCARRC